jgi:sigma-E factor negative regulatory protein RseA
MSDMTDKRKEKISAFLDGDMHRDELMSFSLSAEADDAKLAQRYQMMGDAMRGELSDSSFIDVSHAVREALADEHIIADSPATKSATPADNKAGWFDLSSWFKPVAGMAVAASVAVVMVVTLSKQEAGIHTPIAKNIQQPSTVQLAVEEKQINKNLVDVKDAELNQQRVKQHLEYATQDTLQGRLPYVRAVSYEKKEQSSK